MSSKRGRKIVFWGLLLTLALGAAGIVATRSVLIESWHLYRLDSDDLETRRGSIQVLGKMASRRAILKLVPLLDSEVELRADLLVAFRQICPTAPDSLQREIFAALLAFSSSADWKKDPNSWESLVVLRACAPSAGDALHTIVDHLLDEQEPLRDEIRVAGVNALVDAWPRSQDALERYFTKLPPSEVSQCYSWCAPNLLSPDAKFRELPDGRNYSLFEKPAPWLVSREPARYFARHHPKPEVRAVSLANSLYSDDSDSLAWNASALPKRFHEEESLLVRRAIVRVAGALGQRPDSLDLTRLLYEPDHDLLADIIEARSLWVQRRSEDSGVELFDGVTYTRLPQSSTKSGVLVPWTEDEFTRLREILAKETHPRLRDAASMVFGRIARQRGMRLGKDVQRGFKLHEWGIWRDLGGRLAPVSEVIDELPSFVHKSKALAKDLWDERVDQKVEYVILKPVLHFYSDEPISAWVRVDHLRGRPWTFYPEATDYTIPFFDLRGEQLRPRGRGPRAPGLVTRYETGHGPKDRPGFSPPWLLDTNTPGGDVRKTLESGGPLDSDGQIDPGEHRRRYSSVPWIRPQTPRTQIWNGWTETLGVGVGIEWCGLRIGYDETLEADLARPPDGHWWHHIREVPSANVAVRGEQERFLFYDGSVGFQSMVELIEVGEDPPSLTIAGVPVRRDHLVGIDPNLPNRAKPTFAQDVTISSVLIVRRDEDGSLAGWVLRNVVDNDEPRKVLLGEPDYEADEVKQAFIDLLVLPGLTKEEAGALANTFDEEFFGTTGLRALCLIPQQLYDLALPLNIVPVPEEIVRVGVIWKEISQP